LDELPELKLEEERGAPDDEHEVIEQADAI
jgi:hypothetical protein